MISENDAPHHPGDGLSPAEVEALLFSAALGFDSADEREKFLGLACRDDPELHARLRRLAGAQQAADDFFESKIQVKSEPAGSTPWTDPDELCLEVERYRLIERIGSGGCGVVYLAEQQEPVCRKVALKIIRIGLETPGAVARFEMERQALAAMNHPNIARVLDAGTHAGGRPFLVMELVDGETIANYCDSRNLGIRERLRLFVQVCHGIQHAHQKGVIHRDIKPSNVLVETHESAPVPKIIDFGIARESGVDLMETDDGCPAGLVGSPVYMSPEQVAGSDAVDTRSDIYSLGMLLAELLVGPHRHLPAELMERPQEEIRRMLTERRPALPSAAFASNSDENQRQIARDRNIRPEALMKLCRKELDWLVAKAIQPDPSQRYDTATALAADVLRWLHGEAINARPHSRSYRLAKLVRRNRLLYGAGALAFLGLLGGFSMATVLFLREKEARAAEARLRGQAERAHRAETLARKGWECRSRVAESAVRLRYGDLEGAEQLVEPIPIKETPPSLESISVYKQLADWHRLNGRTEDAEKRFLGMIHALSGIDRSHTDANSDLFLPAAAMLARSAHPERYADLRRVAIDLYQDTRSRIVAERILKSCLLKPTPDDSLRQTAKLAHVLEGDAGDQGKIRQTGWECFSIALFYHRKGDLDRAAYWANRSLECLDWAQRSMGSAKTLLGLVWQKRGDSAKAMEYLTAAETAAGDKLLRILPNDPTGSDYWFDWANLRTLLEEAGWTESGFPKQH